MCCKREETPTTRCAFRWLSKWDKLEAILSSNVGNTIRTLRLLHDKARVLVTDRALCLPLSYDQNIEVRNMHTQNQLEATVQQSIMEGLSNTSSKGGISFH